MLWLLCTFWAYMSGTNAHAEHMRQQLIHTLSIASVPYAHAQHVHQFSHFSNVHFVHVYPQQRSKELMHTHQEMTCALMIISAKNWCVTEYPSGTDAYPECAFQEWCIPWAYTSGTDAYKNHEDRSNRISHTWTPPNIFPDEPENLHSLFCIQCSPW